MEQLFMESVVRLEPIDTIKHGISSAAGIQCSIVAFFLFGIIAGLITGEVRAKKVMMNGILKSLKREHTEQQGLWGKRNAVRF